MTDNNGCMDFEVSYLTLEEYFMGGLNSYRDSAD